MTRKNTELEPVAGTRDARADVPDDRSAGVPPAVSGASRPRFGEVTIRDRGRLPHWEKEGSIYFITFRLADSLPKHVLQEIESERRSVVQTASQLHRPLSPDERRQLERLSTTCIEKYLDAGAGRCWLRRSEIAEVVSSTLTHFAEARYRLFAWCVMPNHVHVVIRIFPNYKLADVVHSWKSFTAKQANKILDRRGEFWQREYYDHLIRDESEFTRSVQYVAENPRKAGLQSWLWVWVCGRDARTTAAEDGGATTS
jgi:REP element-mobilizing transposase RayT